MKIYALLPPVHEVDRYLQSAGLPWGAEVRDAVEAALNHLRQNTAFWGDWSREQLVVWIAERAAQPKGLRRVVNATGTIVHTNLGRSPFSFELLDGLSSLFGGYCNLEYDLERGQRGQRVEEAERLICRLTGAEAALFVNNNASALLLCLQAFALGKEVLLSRGEMVEIGGSFRIPDMLQTSGARLKELGTTNKTHLKDYQQAITDQTAMLLKVHRSNFKITGFTAEPNRSELVQLAEERGLVFLEDLGSGSIEPLNLGNGVEEPGLSSIIAQGAPLVTASGDKLLGGPQAGLVLGRADLIDQLRQHPLYRCLRCDKLTLYLLEQTLRAYSRKDWSAIPTRRMLEESADAVKARAEATLALLPGLGLELVQTQATPGGGALPEASLPSWALSLPGDAEALHLALRRLALPVVGRIREGRLWLDFKTVFEGEIALLAQAIRQVLAKE